MFTSDPDFDLGIMSFSGCGSQKIGKDRNLHWNLTSAGMRRQKTDPLNAGKVVQSVCTKGEKGEIVASGNEWGGESCFQFAFFQPTWFFPIHLIFSNPPDFFSDPPACQQHHRWDNWLNQQLRWKRWPCILNCWINVNYLYVGCFESPWMCPLKTVTARSTVAEGRFC